MRKNNQERRKTGKELCGSAATAAYEEKQFRKQKRRKKN
jgi:hypothetical protein